MRRVRKFRSRKAAESHQLALATAKGLPRYYSRQDVDDGTLVEVGGGRHVPPEEIVREAIPPILVSKTGKSWAVEDAEDERAVEVAKDAWHTEEEAEEALALADTPPAPASKV